MSHTLTSLQFVEIPLFWTLVRSKQTAITLNIGLTSDFEILMVFTFVKQCQDPEGKDSTYVEAKRSQ